MPRAPKQCGHGGCSQWVTGSTYCPRHEAERLRVMAQRRGTTAARGYGSPHQRQRASWAPKVQAGAVTCWRCGELIQLGQRWDLGHDDRNRDITHGPEHVRCNRSTAGRAPGGTPPRPCQP